MVIYVAGNQTDERIRKQNDYEAAKKANIKGNDLAKLEAAYKAAKAVEESAIKSAGNRGLF